MTYYEVVPSDNQWVLGPRRLSGKEYGYNPWVFGMCERVGDDQTPAIFEIDAEGPMVDINLTVYRAPVISIRCAELLQSLLEEEVAQFIRADVQGAEGEWEVINLLDRVDCLDHEQSKIRYHDADHPQKPGKPRSVERMIIDPSRAAGHDLFRLADWEVAVIASERIKNAMEEANITGVEYWPVC